MKLSAVPTRTDGEDVILSVRVRRSNLPALYNGVELRDLWLVADTDGTHHLVLGVEEGKHGQLAEHPTNSDLVYDHATYKCRSRADIERTRTAGTSAVHRVEWNVAV